MRQREQIPEQHQAWLKAYLERKGWESIDNLNSEQWKQLRGAYRQMLVKSKSVSNTLGDAELLEEIKYLKSLSTDKAIRKVNRELLAQNKKLVAEAKIDQQTINRLISEKTESVSNTLDAQG